MTREKKLKSSFFETELESSPQKRKRYNFFERIEISFTRAVKGLSSQIFKNRDVETIDKIE